jgi:hypothetical protein
LKALDAIQRASGRRALILLSDGEDQYGETHADTSLAEARRQDVLVYPVSTGRTSRTFAKLAAVTGRSFHAVERRDLKASLATIAQELRRNTCWVTRRPPATAGAGGGQSRQRVAS